MKNKIQRGKEYFWFKKEPFYIPYRDLPLFIKDPYDLFIKIMPDHNWTPNVAFYLTRDSTPHLEIVFLHFEDGSDVHGLAAMITFMEELDYNLGLWVYKMFDGRTRINHLNDAAEILCFETALPPEVARRILSSVKRKQAKRKQHKDEKKHAAVI
jgi:hypothetical protein